MYKIDGIEIEGTVEVIKTNGGFIIQEVTNLVQEDNVVAFPTAQPIVEEGEEGCMGSGWLEALGIGEEPIKSIADMENSEPDVFEEDEDEIEMIQCNFLAERWLLDYFEESYRKAKQTSTTKVLKREHVGGLIMNKFVTEILREKRKNESN